LLRALRPDLEIVPLRGNVPTRLAKLEREGLDAVVLACAGLERLGLAERIDERIDPAAMLPAVCQGTLALETRRSDSFYRELGRLDDARARTAAAAERAFLTRLEGDCQVPLAAYAEALSDDRIRLRGLVASPDGTSVVRAEALSFGEDAHDLGLALADSVLRTGGSELLARLREVVGA
jgi:hydroxymethylbilane synthase